MRLQSVSQEIERASPNKRFDWSEHQVKHPSPLAELDVLRQIGRALNSTLDEKEIFRLLIEETVAVTPATRGCVFLHDLDRDRLVPRAWYGYTPSQVDSLIDIASQRQSGIIYRVFNTGEVAVTDDVDQDPDYIQVVPNTRSELTVPIRYGLDVVGVIDLECPNPDAFHINTRQFALTIAEQAGIAIGNARRYLEQVEREKVVTRRNEQLRHLLEISRMFGSQHALNDLLDLVVQSIPEAAGFNIALLSLIEGDPPYLCRVAGAGMSRTDFFAMQQLPPPLESYERIFQDRYRISQSYFFPHQERAHWDDEYTYVVLPEVDEWQEGAWHPNDMLLVPLRNSSGVMIGLLSVDDPQDGRIPGRDVIQTLELFAHEAALAIENTQLIDQTQQHVDELKLLRQVGLQVASSLDLNVVLDSIVDSALKLVPASDARIYLYDREINSFECGTQKSRGEDHSRPMASPREDGFTAQVVNKGEILLINDAQHHDLYTRPESSHWGMRAIAGFPLKRAGEILGVMDVSFFYEHIFAQSEIDVLSMLANQAAIAIDNARLYEHAKKRAIHLEALWLVNQRLASILDFDELLEQVAQVIQTYFDYDHINIYLVDEPGQQLVLRAQSSHTESLQAAALELVSLDALNCVPVWVSNHGQPLMLCEDMAGPVACPSLMMDRLNTRSQLAVPLYIGDQIAGVLDVHSHQSDVLTQEDRYVVQSLGVQLSVAFENARLYDELELRVSRRTEELADALRLQALEMDKTRAIVESISDAVVVFDPDGSVTLVNPGTRRTFGVTPRLWKRRNLNHKELPDLSPQDAQVLLAVFDEARRARALLANGDELVTGTIFVLNRVIAASFASVALQDIDPLNIVAVFRDVTQETRLSRMKSEFIAMTAHELRTPMTAIKGYASLLSSGTPGEINETQLGFLKVINANADRLMNLVNDLLDMSKIEDEGLRLNLASVSMADVVAQVIGSLQTQIRNKKQIFEMNVPSDLPEIPADRDRLIQVMTNLISNASKYTPVGGKLVVRGRQADNTIVLQVRDNGIGISRQDQDRLFTRFFRAENAVDTQEGGTGLGLVICREIVKRHGGEIRVESELGRGSTFSVILPIKRHDTTG